jgi:hypothetical protein
VWAAVLRVGQYAFRVLDTLDAAAVRRWCGSGLAALRAHQDEIDELNVYPVPDGDTGTNLVLTLTSAQQALTQDGTPGRPEAADAAGDEPPGAGQGGTRTPLGHALRLMARGALLGARGNSGVIVSQILRGMADALASTVTVRGADLARALRSASEAAYAAVTRPVEGTVLSVVAAAAEAAARTGSDDLLAVARAAATAASEALARTPQQLPVLARAGVVDAGGRGLCLLLDALVDVLGGAVADGRVTPDAIEKRAVEAVEIVEAVQIVEAVEAVQLGDTVPVAPTTQGRHTHTDEAHGYGYEVQYLLDAAPEAMSALRRALAAIGDSLVVVGTGDGDPPTWNVHVHVDAADIGPAVEAGVVAGRPYRITVTPLLDRSDPHAGRGVASERWDRIPQARARPVDFATVDVRARAAVVVATGDGLTALFTAEGATVVGHNPSTAEVLAAVRSTRAGRVVLLPNDANTQAVAVSAAREAAGFGVRVSVVPTRSPVQALAALAVRDPQRAFSDDVIAMAEAAGACRYGEVCTARREALTVAGQCRPGDLLGLVDGEVHVIGTDLAEVCRRLLDRMLGGGGELTTLVLGADAPAELEGTLSGHLARVWPFVELQCYAGGQPRYHLLVGVE